MRLRRFFTLVEMLIVIAIVAILASLLAPSLQRALDQARTVSCANNERQLGLAVALWNGEHRYAPANGGNSGHGVGGRARLDGQLETPSCLMRLKYLGDPKVYFCPLASASPEVRANTSFEWWGWGFYYRWGIDLCGGQGLVSTNGQAGWAHCTGNSPDLCEKPGSYPDATAVVAKWARFPSPAETVLCGDNVSFVDYADYGENAPDHEHYTSYGMFFVHNGFANCNVLYLDGHVKAKTPDKVGSSGGFYHSVYSRNANR